MAAFSATPALADRALTDHERAKLEEALKALGRTGGRQDGVRRRKFEVEGALCADGKRYEIAFDASFTMTEKEVDDD